MLLQTLRTRDFDEQVRAFPQWNLEVQWPGGPHLAECCIHFALDRSDVGSAANGKANASMFLSRS
jgi:hypothetical protein